MKEVTGSREEDEKLRALLRETIDLCSALDEHAIVARTDARGKITFVNDRFCAISKYSREELLGQDHRILNSGHHPKEFMRDLWRTIGAGGVWHGEIKNRAKDGTFYWVDATIVPFLDDHGKPREYVAVRTDITQRKQAEEALRLFRSLVDQSNDIFEVIDPATARFLDVNEKGHAEMGYTRAEYLSLRVIDIDTTITESNWPQAAEKIRLAGSMSGEGCHRRKDGTTFPVEFNAKWVTLDRDYIVTAVRDVTERKNHEAQLLREQRMECIGALAGGIAHDLNNSLGPIIMSLDLMKMKFPDPASQRLLDIVSYSAQRGADMVRQVLAFGRGVEGRRVELQVKHLVDEIAKIANETFLKNIEVRTEIPHDLWTVVGDPTQMHQVLLNLCVNARDAMPNGGKLTISAENITLDAHYAGLNPDAKAGPYVFLKIEDSGTGMPPELIEKIFDPFFTTKEMGKGTGLGLSTSLAIVKSHGGFIRVYSEVGKGTAFHVHLPAHTETSPVAAAELAAEMPCGNGELILVVDDEASVRQITKQTLEGFGYRVVLANDGIEAISIFSSRGKEIAAVLTDMMMPIMDGAATIHILRRMNPQLPIIATSGLTASVATMADLGVEQFLAKPFTAETLLKTLRQGLVRKP